MLREALDVIAQDAVLASIGVTADEEECTTVIEARLPHAAGAGWAARQSPGLREQAARAGASVDIEPGPDGVRFAWRLPLIAASAPEPQR
jgi:hypothetical protein